MIFVFDDMAIGKVARGGDLVTSGDKVRNEPRSRLPVKEGWYVDVMMMMMMMLAWNIPHYG